MTFESSSKKLTPEQKRVMRAHGEWASAYALMWIIGTICIFGGIFLLLDYVGASDSVRTQSLVLLATISIVNAVWQAAGVVTARIELMLRHEGSNEHLFD